MGQVLYRKYRSRSLDEIVGQEHVTTTLANALKTGKISHAYLLTGPRGTGKTSIARILAHEINGLPYSEETHFDIIEIDAASNNGVEDVRALRDKVQSAPTSAKYKVYIIDEVHMLSKPAFNALLKTLEEPPEHVIFILATTEAHKLPETIISRTQRYSFRPVPLEKVVAHLKHIASKEKIKVDDEALQLIAEHGEGSFRDSISLLDQASSLGGVITLSEVEQLLGRAPSALIDELLLKLISQDASAVTSSLRELYDKGFEPAMISVQLSKRLRARLGQASTDISSSDAIALLHQLLAVPASHRPAQLLELVLLGYALQADDANSPAVKKPAPLPKQTPEKSLPNTKNAVSPIEAVVPQTSPTDTATNQPETTQSDTTSKKLQAQAEVVTNETETSEPAIETSEPLSNVDTDELWHNILQDIKQTHNTLYGIARMAKPVLEGNTLTLSTKFPFHQKRLSETKNRDIMAACATKLRGVKTNVLCTISEAADGATSGKSVSMPDVSAISNIFGGAELLD